MSAGLQRLALATTITAFLVMVMGSYVSKSGAGLACPDWPLCQGRLLPLFTWPVLLEWTHRLLAMFVVVLALALAFTARRDQWKEPWATSLAFLALGLLAVQVALGGVTIYLQLHPLVVTAHLAVALMFFGTLVWLTASLRSNIR